MILYRAPHTGRLRPCIAQAPSLDFASGPSVSWDTSLDIGVSARINACAMGAVEGLS